MKYSENGLNILALETYKGIGKAWIVNNIKGNETIYEIINKLNEKVKEEVSFANFEFCKDKIKEKLDLLGDSYDGLITIVDKNFPKYRGNVKASEQPIYLLYKGDIDLLAIDNNNITVIGLLNPDEEIEKREKKLVEEIVKNDITIVSGLAFGCDSIAHKQSIMGGKTIAILPSPLNNILPAKNRELAFEIVDQGGLLISEYYDEPETQRKLISRYIERDRLQALFCDTIILIASYSTNSSNKWSNLRDKKLDSGARWAMGYAKDYNIPRAVMYNEKEDINNPMFDLNREIIEEKENIRILTPKILDEIIENIKKKKEKIERSLF